MTQVLINEVTMQLKCLPDAMQQQVLTFIQSLQQRPLRGTPARKLLKFAGMFSMDEAHQMLQAIEQDCRQVDLNEW